MWSGKGKEEDVEQVGNLGRNGKAARKNRCEEGGWRWWGGLKVIYWFFSLILIPFCA